MIDGVLTLIDDPENPLKPKPKIITNNIDLELSAQSKYSLAPVNTILKETAKYDAKYAYVGLPCQIHSIRKLQMQNDPNVKNLTLLIGSYCGAIHYFKSIVDYLKKYGINNLDEVKNIQYRAGEWPGKLLVTLYDGREFSLSKFYANYMNMLYIVERCQVCSDLSNELSDFSGADAWAPTYEERGKGYSLIVTRTIIGDDLIKKCIDKGILISEKEVSRNEILTMHSHGIDNKKIGSYVRIKLWKLMGKKTPNYNLEISKIPFKRFIIALLVSLAFKIGSLNGFRWLLRQLPMDITGRFFQWVRKILKLLTKPKNNKTNYFFTPIKK